MRADGKYYTVAPRKDDSDGLRKEDEVEVIGHMKYGVFHADRVRASRDSRDIRDSRSSDWDERKLKGRVTDVDGSHRFTIRTESGRKADVVSDERLPRGLSRGDQVSVKGRWDGDDRRDNVFRADSVSTKSDDDDDNYEDEGNRVDFHGKITRASHNGEEWDYVVRNDGREHLVRFNEKFRIGDKVRVRGKIHHGRIKASDIDKQ